MSGNDWKPDRKEPTMAQNFIVSIIDSIDVSTVLPFLEEGIVERVEPEQALGPFISRLMMKWRDITVRGSIVFHIFTYSEEGFEIRVLEIS